MQAPSISWASAYDLHVLGTPPAFILSQDQTLRCLYISSNISVILSVRAQAPSPRAGKARSGRTGPQSPLRLTETNVSFPRRPPRSGRRRSLLVLSHSVNVLPQTLAFPPFASAKLLPPARSRKYFRNLFPLCRAAAHATR